MLSFSIVFPSNSKRDASFHCTPYNFPATDCDSLHNLLSDFPLENIFKLDACTAATELYERVQV